MKLLRCPKCNDSIVIGVGNVTRICACGETAGKYLKDNITAVVSKGSIVYGIDNNSLNNAIHNYTAFPEKYPKYKEERFDFFFVGWVPTIPGEVIWVDSVHKVQLEEYDQEINWTSSPTSTDINEKFKFSRLTNFCRNCLERIKKAV